MEKQKKTGLDSLGNVEQIREILFGPQLKELQSKMDKFETKIDQLQQHTDNSLSAMKTELNKRFDEEIQNLQKRIKQNTAQLQEEITDSNEQVIRLERRLQMAMDNKAQELEDAISTNKNHIASSAAELSNALVLLETSLKNDLDAAFNQIDDTKLSKEAMTQMLMDMAMKIQNVALDVSVETPEA